LGLKIYQYSKCGTCRNALKWLKGKGIEGEVIDITTTPPNKTELKKMLEGSGLDIKAFFNTSGEVYKEMKLKDKLPAMSEDEKLALLASNGRLIKRPIVVDDGKITVGFKEEQFERVWG